MGGFVHYNLSQLFSPAAMLGMSSMSPDCAPCPPHIVWLLLSPDNSSKIALYIAPISACSVDKTAVKRPELVCVAHPATF